MAFGNGTGAFASYGAALGYKTQVGYADGEAGTESFASRVIVCSDINWRLSESIETIIPYGATGIIFDYFGENASELTQDPYVIECYDKDNNLLTLESFNMRNGEQSETLPYEPNFYRIVVSDGGLQLGTGIMKSPTFTFSIPDNLGTSSLAFGSYTAALGNHSLAGGLYTTASGSRSLAFGEGSSDDRTEASGDVSIAIGKHVKATNTGSIALGADTTASGEYSIALGKNTEATMPHAFANGINTKATQSHAIALGSNSNAKGIASLAFGDTNNAEKAYTWALGQRNTVNAIHSLAVGRDNTTNG